MLQKPESAEVTPKDDPVLKYLKIILFAVILTMVFIGGLSAYFAFFSGKSLDILDKGSCTENGITYSDGDAVPSGDSCNTCSCQDGNKVCTTMGCDVILPQDNKVPTDDSSGDEDNDKWQMQSVVCNERDVGTVTLEAELPENADLELDITPSDCNFSIRHGNSVYQVTADVGIYFPSSYNEAEIVDPGSGLIRHKTNMSKEFCNNLLGSDYAYNNCDVYYYGYDEGENSCYQSQADECLISPKSGQRLFIAGVGESDTDIQISFSALYISDQDKSDHSVLEDFDKIVSNISLHR